MFTKVSQLGTAELKSVFNIQLELIANVSAFHQHTNK